MKMRTVGAAQVCDIIAARHKSPKVVDNRRNLLIARMYAVSQKYDEGARTLLASLLCHVAIDRQEDLCEFQRLFKSGACARKGLAELVAEFAQSAAFNCTIFGRDSTAIKLDQRYVRQWRKEIWREV